jgi:DnaJ-class molecular chaperone
MKTCDGKGFLNSSRLLVVIAIIAFSQPVAACLGPGKAEAKNTACKSICGN